MAFGTVADADIALGHVPAWVALDEAAKARALDTAALWLRASYALPVPPNADQLALIVQAEQVAARVSLTTPLFPEPGQAVKALTKKRTKVDVLEKEEQWAEPETGLTGQVMIAEVDAILSGVVVRTGATDEAWAFVV